MLDIRNKPHQSHPSLLPLRMALIIAENKTPARPVQQVTSDEQHALELIEKIRTEYSKPLPFTSWKDDSGFNMFRLQEVIGNNV